MLLRNIIILRRRYFGKTMEGILEFEYCQRVLYLQDMRLLGNFVARQKHIYLLLQEDFCTVLFIETIDHRDR